MLDQEQRKIEKFKICQDKGIYKPFASKNDKEFQAMRQEKIDAQNFQNRSTSYNHIILTGALMTDDFGDLKKVRSLRRCSGLRLSQWLQSYSQLPAYQSDLKMVGCV